MKRQHPIRKMLDDLKRGHLDQDEAKAARHVKPLLDALWGDHEVCREGVRLGDTDDCKTCHLIAEWRAKL